MASTLIVQGETLTYSSSGSGNSIIINTWKARAPKNLLEYATDLKYVNVHGYNILTASCTASAGSGVNLFSLPVSPFPSDPSLGTLQGVSYDGINVTNPAGSGAITGVGIQFPPNPGPGQLFILIFDVAVTTLTLVPETNYTINGGITSASANQVNRWSLVGSIWKPC